MQRLINKLRDMQKKYPQEIVTLCTADLEELWQCEIDDMQKQNPFNQYLYQDLKCFSKSLVYKTYQRVYDADCEKLMRDMDKILEDYPEYEISDSSE